METSTDTQNGISREAVVAQNEPEVTVTAPENQIIEAEPFKDHYPTPNGIFAVETDGSRYITSTFDVNQHAMVNISDVSGEEVVFEISEIERVEYYGEPHEINTTDA